MSFPDSPLGCRVEMAFGADLTADPVTWTWTDVGATMVDGRPRLLSQRIEIRRGMADETTSPQPSTVTVTLDNRDGALTPGNPLSPWWPNVELGTPLRVTVIDGADEHQRFQGEVSSIVPAWPHGDHGRATGSTDAVVTVTAAGILRRLAQRQPVVQSALRSTIPLSSPVGYWPLEDSAISSIASPAIPATQPAAVVGIDFARNDSLPGSRPLPVANRTGGAIRATVTGAAAGTVNVNYLYYADGPTETELEVLRVYCSGTVATWVVTLDGSSGTAPYTARIYAYDIDGSLIDSAVAGVGDDVFTGWQWLWFWAAQDGSDITNFLAWWNIEGAAGGFSLPLSSQTVGAATQVVVPTVDRWALGHLVVHDVQRQPATWPVDGWRGETATARVTRIGTTHGIEVTIDDDGDLVTEMGPQPHLSPLDLLVDVARADQGLLTEGVDGRLHYITHSARCNRVPVVIDAASDEITLPFEPARDDQRYRNSVTVSRPAGGTFTVSVDQARGTWEESLQANVATDPQAEQVAGWRLHLGTWPGMRYPELTVDLAAAPHLIPTLTQVTPGETLRVTGLPAQHPPAAVDLVVEGINEVVSPDEWRITFACGPGGPWIVGVLEDDELGRLDTSGAELAAPVDENDTTLTVATTAGPVWIDSAGFSGEFPFRVLIGGEVMVVTAVSGTTSPQTFTVTRAANGVAKSHPAGTPVELVDALVLAL